MAELLLEFGGKARVFHLRLGEYIDLEAATGAAMGTLFKRFGTNDYHAMDVFHTLKQGLIGGGMELSDVEKLVRDQMDTKPLMVLAGTASDVIIHATTGIKSTDHPTEDRPPASLDSGAVFHALVQVGVPPHEARKVRYADYVNLLRATSGSGVEPPTDEEFNAMLAEWEARQSSSDAGEN